MPKLFKDSQNRTVTFDTIWLVGRIDNSYAMPKEKNKEIVKAAPRNLPI
jgi:hypothetical protein